MSLALDSLGWKKVFVDIRNEIPYSVSLPRLSSRRVTTMDDNNNNSSSSSSSLSLEDDNNNNIDSLRLKKVVGSKDVASAVTNKPDSQKVFLPMGHNMIVAFSRDKYSTRINKGGRPIVDSLAKELVDDIFSWKQQEEGSLT